MVVETTVVVVVMVLVLSPLLPTSSISLKEAGSHSRPQNTVLNKIMSGYRKGS